MPVFSFTAPHITPEEEKQELESLSKEERRELYNDLYGVYPPQEDDDDCDNGAENHKVAIVEETPESIEMALQALENYIEETPLAKKLEYLQAKSQAPKLLETEANPIKFLRCEKFNIEAAANRMFLYWKQRHKLFGPSGKTFLPMTLTGAMAGPDADVIELGILAIHPPDSMGRGVLYFDRIKAVPPLAPRDAVLRCVFYMIHVMSEEVHIQKNGLVCLTNMKGYDLYKHFDRLLSKQKMQVMQCAPVKLLAWHMLAGSANGVMSLVLPVMKHVVPKECRLRMVVHSGNDGKMLESLKPYGLTSKNISQTLSGDYKPCDFMAWLEEWKLKEQEREQEKELENKRETTATAAATTTEQQEEAEQEQTK